MVAQKEWVMEAISKDEDDDKDDESVLETRTKRRSDCRAAHASLKAPLLSYLEYLQIILMFMT